MKAKNVVVTDGWLGLLSDLGESTWDEAPSTAVGTPGFMAPEMTAGERYSSKVDSFSYGVMLFECFGFCGGAFNPRAQGSGGRSSEAGRAAQRLQAVAEREVLGREAAAASTGGGIPADAAAAGGGEPGSDYAADLAILDAVPPVLLGLALKCVSADPAARPSFPELCERMLEVFSDELEDEEVAPPVAAPSAATGSPEFPLGSVSRVEAGGLSPQSPPRLSLLAAAAESPPVWPVSPGARHAARWRQCFAWLRGERTLSQQSFRDPARGGSFGRARMELARTATPTGAAGGSKWVAAGSMSRGSHPTHISPQSSFALKGASQAGTVTGGRNSSVYATSLSGLNHQVRGVRGCGRACVCRA